MVVLQIWRVNGAGEKSRTRATMVECSLRIGGFACRIGRFRV
jgi:hypothetical protein